MANQAPPTLQHGHLARNTVVVAAVVSLAIAGVVVAYSMLGKVFRPASTPAFGYRVLLNGTITVAPNSVYYIEFSVPEGGPDVQVLDIQVSGDFAVSDNNAIQVYVTDGNNFNPISYGFSPYYDSGISTAGNINATLPSGGTYYLVYDNHNYNYNYTQTPAKTVMTQVTLNYTLF